MGGTRGRAQAQEVTWDSSLDEQREMGIRELLAVDRQSENRREKSWDHKGRKTAGQEYEECDEMGKL